MLKKVVIFQHRLLHYRVDFFELLKKKCQDNSIDLYLVYGQASSKEMKRNDEGSIEWANKVKNFYLTIGGVDLLWQTIPSDAKSADLVVLMQENRILSNYFFLIFKGFLKGKVAYWGHGANFQSDSPNGVRERWKKYWINKVDWWFGYTEITKGLLINAGFPVQQVTVLNNAVDTKGFYSLCKAIDKSDIDNARKLMGISDFAKVGIFCGSLYKDKKIDLMLESAEVIRESCDFHLIILGSGPEFNHVLQFAQDKPWVHLLGVQTGYNKALNYRLSDIMLNPGSLGLHILDSFSIGIPIVSTLNAKHGPEIAYLENGHNGVLTDDNVASYSSAVIKLLEDSHYRKSISQNALSSSKQFTLEIMADNFFDGIKMALQ